MAGRNARIQTVNKAAARRLFFYAKYFMFLCVLPPFSFPYNCKRKQAARTQAASKRLHNAGESESEKRLHNVTRGTVSRAAKR